MNKINFSNKRVWGSLKNKVSGLMPFFLFLSLCSGSLSSATLSPELPEATPRPPTNASPVVDKKYERISKQLQEKMAKYPADQMLNVIVMLKGPEKATTFQKLVGPFQVKHEFSLFHGFAAKMTTAQIRALSTAPRVFEIQEDAAVKAYIADVRSDFGINAASSLASPALSGAGIGICAIDTGVDTAHQQTNEHVFAFCDATTGGCNVAADGSAITAGEPAAYDDQGHGTAVVSAAAGDGNPNATYAGVARNAGVAAAKVLNSSGSGSDSDVIKGVEWCAGLPTVKVLNLSLGEVDANTASTNALTFAVNCVAEPAWSVGGVTCAYPSRAAKVVVAAAGNSGPAQYQVFSPGEALKAIAVGATYNKTEAGDALAAFSSRGPTWNGIIKPDLVAPGANVTTANSGTVNGYSGRFGTSFSAPIVTGVVALMLEADPSLTPSEIKSILETTARHWGSPTKNNDWGAGQMDAYSAIRQVLGLSPGSWGFSAHTYLTGHLDPDIDNTLNGDEEWLFPFELSSPNLPIAATMIIGGDWTCDWQNLPFFGEDCVSTSVGPELDMQLISSGGTIIDTSACPVPYSADPTCGTGSYSGNLYGTEGRQEMHVIKPPSGGFGVGTYTLRVFRATDAYGNYDGSQPADFFVELQNAASAPPQLSVTINQAAGQSDPSNSASVNFTVVFSQPVSDFATGDVTLAGTAGATTATVTGSGTTYNVAVSGMTQSGAVTASINAGAAHDSGGNANTASTSTDNVISYDTTSPTVTINQAAGQSDPTSSSPINFAVVFSEPVSGFATADVVLGGTAGAATATVTGSGTTYNVAASGMTRTGTVIASIASGVAQDGAGNGNAAATSTDNTVNYQPAVVSSPAAPSNLSAAAVSQTQVNLAWTDNSNNETQFRIERCTGSKCNFSSLSLLIILPRIDASSTGNINYQDTNAVRNTRYKYRVRAENASGPSAFSNIASATTPR